MLKGTSAGLIHNLGLHQKPAESQARLSCIRPVFIIKMKLFFSPRTKKTWWGYVLRTGTSINATDLRLQILPNVVSDASVCYCGSLHVFIVVLNSRHTYYSTTNLFISPAAHLSVGGCFCQQDTDVKDRLLHKQCLKCDYNQMCMQIISVATDFVISHRCMLSEMHFTCCSQGNKKENKPSLFSCQLVKKTSTTWWKVLHGMISTEREV